MTNRKLFISFVFLLLTTACGAALTDIPGKDGVDPDEMRKAEDEYCSQGQSLTTLTNGTEVLFSELTQRSRIFKFSTTAGEKCITKDNINETWDFNGGSVWFNLNPNSKDNCLENNSLWEVVNSTTSGFGQYYYLKRIKDDSSPRLLEMNAHQAVRGTYARDRVGLQIMICTNN